MGQKPVGERAFELLENAQDKRFKIVAACSNENTKNTWWNSNAIASKANCRDVSYHFIANERSSGEALIKIIEDTGVDTLISVQHPNVIPGSVLKKVKYNAFNLHLAKLPDYRGYFSINHALLKKEKEYSVTIHWMIESTDAGDIAFEKTISISLNETAFSLYQKAEYAGLEIFTVLIEYLKNNKDVPRTKQLGDANYFGKDSLNGLREIKNMTDFDEVDVKTRAFYSPPFEPAYFVLKKKFYVTPNVGY